MVPQEAVSYLAAPRPKPPTLNHGPATPTPLPCSTHTNNSHTRQPLPGPGAGPGRQRERVASCQCPPSVCTRHPNQVKTQYPSCCPCYSLPCTSCQIRSSQRAHRTWMRLQPRRLHHVQKHGIFRGQPQQQREQRALGRVRDDTCRRLARTHRAVRQQRQGGM